jgi:uncharacterized protein with HEPN domain
MKKPERPELAYLKDIQRAAELAVAFTSGITRGQFDKDLKGQHAVMNNLTIIGEATKHISHEFRNVHPKIPWKKMAAMRDVLIHNYHEANLDVVWNAVMVALPELLTQLKPLIPRNSG